MNASSAIRDPIASRRAREAWLMERGNARARHMGLLRRLKPKDMARFALGISGLKRLAEREFLAVRIVENLVHLRSLPRAFDGFRLLQLSDLHFDLDLRLVEVVKQRLAGCRFDLAVCTGDYLDDIDETWTPAVAAMAEIIPLLGDRPLGILGNHDFADMIQPLELAGLKILMNQSERLERNASALWICGVDDPHVYRNHDLVMARKDVPAGSCAILLSHSPETYREAAALDYALHLSGHTHGGQICLPGGIALLTNAPVPRRLVAGSWIEAKMAGYTSRGTGSGAIAARLFCRPEITLHTLKCVD